MLALIPARSGSVRVPDKNIKNINGHPLLAYSINAALKSGIFEDIVVCTDSSEYAKIASYYGAQVPSLRPSSISGKDSPDSDWVNWILKHEGLDYRRHKYAFILRPTNPFRNHETINRAYKTFLDSNADTLRAVRPVTEHPGKMWVKQQDSIVPLIPLSLSGIPFHSNQTNTLFEAFVQDASLEIFTIQTFLKSNSITGSKIVPFFARGREGFDINTPSDLELMYKIIQDESVKLEKIEQKNWY